MDMSECVLKIKAEMEGLLDFPMGRFVLFFGIAGMLFVIGCKNLSEDEMIERERDMREHPTVRSPGGVRLFDRSRSKQNNDLGFGDESGFGRANGR